MGNPDLHVRPALLSNKTFYFMYSTTYDKAIDPRMKEYVQYMLSQTNESVYGEGRNWSGTLEISMVVA